VNGIPSYPTLQISELIGPILDRVENGTPADHISFGLPDLDHLTGNGLAPGKLIVIAGHDGHGSSTVAFDIARNAAVIEDVPTRLTTLTGTPEEAAQQILAAQAGVPIVRLATGTLNDQDTERLAHGVKDVLPAPLYIDENAFTSSVGWSVDGRDIKLNVIDGAHLMRNDRFFGDPECEIENIAQELKKSTKGGPAIVVTLPLVLVGGRQEPHLSDFGKFTPFIGWADMVLLTYRPDAVEREDPRAGEIDITVAKHRNGATGTVTACFQAPYGRIVSFTK
jgi:replicative DNA helicase